MTAGSGYRQIPSPTVRQSQAFTSIAFRNLHQGYRGKNSWSVLHRFFRQAGSVLNDWTGQTCKKPDCIMQF